MKKLLIAIMLLASTSIFGQTLNFQEKKVPATRVETLVADSISYYGFVAPNDQASNFSQMIILKVDFAEGYLYAADGDAVTFNHAWAQRASYTYSPIVKGSVDFDFAKANNSFSALVSIDSLTSLTSSTAAASTRQADYVVGSWDGTVTYTSSTTLTLSGSYPSITSDAQVVYVHVTNGTTSKTYVSGVNGISLTHSGGVITLSGAVESTPFASGAHYEVGLRAKPVGYDIGLDAVKTVEQATIEFKWTDPEMVIDEADQDSGDVTRSVVDILGSGYKFASFNYELYSASTADTVTLTVWATNNTDADNTADTDWEDVSTTILGAAQIQAINTTSTGLIIRATPLPVERMMFKVYYGGTVGTEDNAAEIHLVRTN